ncbi:MAG: MFS transporter [Rhizobiales bacterium]|nr:MFS transporter [Hyphomicrobiales bacterium]
MSTWIWPLVITLVLQVVSAFLSRLTPFLAPILTAEAGISPATVGYMAALNTAGSIAFLIAGAPLLRRAGPVRTLQIGVTAAGLGALLIAWPTAFNLYLASFLIGIGYGPSPSAGSEILQRHAPARRRTVIFSIKQAGVPIGGVLGGVALPLFATGRWENAIYASTAIALAAVIAVQPSRETIDKERDPRQRLSLGAFASLRNLTAPIRALGLSPSLPTLTAASFCFAIAQGVLLAFFVTYMVVDIGLSLSIAAGLFAINQAVSVFGRVLMGWIVDRAGSAITPLRILSVASAATTALLALCDASWPLWTIALLAAVSGITIVSWNGIFLAEVARLTPPAHVGEASAGSTLLTFVGYVIGPAAFAALVDLSGSYRIGFFVVILFSLSALIFLASLSRRNA